MKFTSETARAAALKSADVRGREAVRISPVKTATKSQSPLLRSNYVTLRKKYAGEEGRLRRKVIAQQKKLFAYKSKIRSLLRELRHAS